MVTLTIQPPGSPPVTHVLKDETITIGRMAGNTIVVNHSSVSLVHAKITRKDGEYFLKDLNSTNGTLVNGQTIAEARLRDRDVVRFADVSAEFAVEAKAGENALTAPAPATQGAVPVAHLPTPVVVPAATPKSTPARRSTALNSLRLVSTVVGVCGAIVVLGVTSFLAWNFTHQQKAKSEAQLAQNAPAITPPKPTPRETPAAATPLPTEEQPAPDLPQLIKTLQDPDPAARRQAVATLHSMGPDGAGATPALHTALSDPDQEVRLWAALTLINNKSYDKAIPPILVHELHDEKPMLRQLACVSLGLLPYEPSERQLVLPELVAAANNDADEDVRKAASSALGVIDPDGTAKGLTK